MRGLVRRGTRLGVIGGSRGWTVVWMVAGVVQVVRWLADSGERVVLREELGPGETISITATRPE